MLALALALGTLAAAPSAGLTNPRAHGAWIADEADVIPPAIEARLNRLIDRLERDVGDELVVVTVDDCDGPPKALSTTLFLTWGVGKEGTDNGLLILLVINKRRLEMELGYGLVDPLGDGWLTALQAEVMVPKLEAGDAAGALEAEVVRVEAELRVRADRVARAKAAARGR